MSSSSSEMNKYWIPHLDIHRKVITQELQYYLGPDATVRPYTREVSDHHNSWLVPASHKLSRAKMAS
jgi:hypothetical protein